jgi:RimJ/RimL family protein N-acetyltransferase
MELNLQPKNLENEIIKLVPLEIDDFERLYEVASDALIWEQHPNKDRYKREVFEAFFMGGMASKGAFIVIDKKTEKPIGSSRFYDFDKEKKAVAIGYTFLAREFWGTNYNKTLKSLMLDYAFLAVDTVIFHIGANNIRSQKAIAKIGGVKFYEEEMTYLGDKKQNLNYFYQITKEAWIGHSSII